MRDLYSVSAPGYFITFSYQLFGCMYVWMNRRRFSPLKTLLLQGAGTLLITGCAFLLESPDRRFYVPRLLMILALTFGLMYICMKVSFRKCLYFLPFAFTLAEFTTALEWQMYYYGTAVKHVPDVLLIRGPFFVCVYGGVLLASFFSNRPFRGYNEETEPGTRDILQVFVLAVLIFLVSNISNIRPDTVFSSGDPMQIFRLRTLTDLAGVISMYFVHSARKGAADRMRADLLEETMLRMKENYRISRESMELVSEKYHDLKHQIAWLKSGASGEERRSGLEKLEREIADFEAQADTGDEILDTIVMAKRIAWKKEGVHIVCIADGRLLSFMDSMDRAAVFGNLLDNAVEAVMRLQREERLINLSVGEKADFFLISCENRSAGRASFSNGLPLTDKADRRMHGYGTRSIRSIAEKYGGAAVFREKNGWFIARVMIPRQS